MWWGPDDAPMLRHRSRSLDDVSRPCEKVVLNVGASSLLDNLLAESPDYKDPLKGFMLSAPYRGRRPIYNPDDAVRRSAAAAVVPLTKCASAPATCFADRIARGDYGDSGLEDRPQSVEPTPEERMWTCRGCGTTDCSKLSTGSDSSMSCEVCGTVESNFSMIAGSRQKNCAREDDKTTVADEPCRDEHEIAGLALVNGDETCADRRKRHLHASTGTRVSRAVARKYDLSAAQARIDAEVVREARARVDGDPKYIRKRAAVLRFVTTVHQLLGPSLDERIRKHIRMEAVRVVGNGFEHARCCNDAHCQIAIPARANALIALCTVQKCLECLVCEDTTPPTGVRGRTSIGAIAPEVSRHELLKCLDETRQMHTHGAGASQRAQVAAAVGLVLDWIPEQIALPCASAAGNSPVLGSTVGNAGNSGNGAATAESVAMPVHHHHFHQQHPAAMPSLLAGNQAASGSDTGAPMLPPFALPPPFQLAPSASTPSMALVLSEDDGSPKFGGDGSPNDAIWTLRNMIFGAWRLANLRADVRQAATAAVQQPALAHWIRTENTLPMCVLGVAMLKAASIKLELDGGTDELLANYCHQYNISPTTANDAATRIAAIMQVEQATTLGVFGDGIF